MLRKILCFLSLCVAIFCFEAQFASAAKYDETRVRCKVCDRAIANVWLQGVALRKHCKLHNTDPRCLHTNLDRNAIEDLVKDTCVDVTKVNSAQFDANGNFQMTPLEAGEESNNDSTLNAIMTKSCQQWVLDANTVPTLTRFIFANLDAGKPTQAVLNPLQTKFCQKACSPPTSTDDSEAEL